MISLTAAAIFFVGIHLFVSGTSLRATIVARIGEAGFQGAFSVASAVGLTWLCWAYALTDDIPLWGQLYSLKPVAIVLMVVAFLFAAIGLTTPSPTAAGGESQLDSEEPVKGILRITRHPFLWGVALWAAVHLVLNGDAASVVFFGALLVLALTGPRSIDAKRRARFGERWERFEARTSNVPFAAILQGRNGLDVAGLGWWRIGVGVALFVLFLLAHTWLFGVSPFPV